LLSQHDGGGVCSETGVGEPGSPVPSYECQLDMYIYTRTLHSGKGSWDELSTSINLVKSLPRLVGVSANARRHGRRTDRREEKGYLQDRLQKILDYLPTLYKQLFTRPHDLVLSYFLTDVG
jgi:hypothetical protein